MSDKSGNHVTKLLPEMEVLFAQSQQQLSSAAHAYYVLTSHAHAVQTHRRLFNGQNHSMHVSLKPTCLL